MGDSGHLLCGVANALVVVLSSPAEKKMRGLRQCLVARLLLAAIVCAAAAAQENMDEAAKQEILEDEFCSKFQKTGTVIILEKVIVLYAVKHLLMPGVEI